MTDDSARRVVKSTTCDSDEANPLASIVKAYGVSGVRPLTGSDVTAGPTDVVNALRGVSVTSVTVCVSVIWLIVTGLRRSLTKLIFTGPVIAGSVTVYVEALSDGIYVATSVSPHITFSVPGVVPP